MTTHFEYKGYLGSAEVDIDGGVLVGRLRFIPDIITYSAHTAGELEAAFREAVEDYLTACKEEGVEPDLPCKGSFNVRTGPERHRSAVLAARRHDMSLNEFVCGAIDSAIADRPESRKVEVTVRLSREEIGTTGASEDAPTWKSFNVSTQH